MNVTVLVKQIPDPANPYELTGDGRLKRDVATKVMDPGDEYGVEAALRVADSTGGEVTIVSMGPAAAMEAIRRALSMGAHKGVLITDDALAGADALATARVLATAVKKNPFDLVIAGVESTDGSTGVVPQMVAELLGIPTSTFVKEMEIKDSVIRVQRQTAGGYDVVECPIPAVITVTAGVNEPRYPTFKGIMQAKSKPVDQVSLADLGIGGEDAKATQSVAGVNPAPARGAGEKFEDDGSGAAKVADYLKELKVI